jgi:low affinity Fe/Cu permease
MNPKQFTELQNTIIQSIDENIDTSVEKYVNGKIHRLDEKIDDYIKSDIEHRNEYKRETLEWRERIEKKVEPLDNLNGFKKTVTGVVVFLSSIGALTLIIIKLLNGGKE